MYDFMDQRSDKIQRTKIFMCLLTCMACRAHVVSMVNGRGTTLHQRTVLRLVLDYHVIQA